jgi:hypothetical protein
MTVSLNSSREPTANATQVVVMATRFAITNTITIKDK